MPKRNAEAGEWIDARLGVGRVIGGQAYGIRDRHGEHCAACHGAGGQGDAPVAAALSRKPAKLVAGPSAWTPPSEDLSLCVAMPGHELFSDAQVRALKDRVLALRSGK